MYADLASVTVELGPVQRRIPHPSPADVCTIQVKQAVADIEAACREPDTAAGCFCRSQRSLEAGSIISFIIRDCAVIRHRQIACRHLKCWSNLLQLCQINDIRGCLILRTFFQTDYSPCRSLTD
ncbi:hypothetical protein D3C75_407250 [compost metagenome]